MFIKLPQVKIICITSFTMAGYPMAPHLKIEITLFISVCMFKII